MSELEELKNGINMLIKTLESDREKLDGKAEELSNDNEDDWDGESIYAEGHVIGELVATTSVIKQLQALVEEATQ